MKIKLFILYGHTGNNKKWIVKVYKEKIEAEKHAKFANQWAEENTNNISLLKARGVAKKNPYDKQMECEDACPNEDWVCWEGIGTYYYVEEIKYQEEDTKHYWNFNIPTQRQL